MRATQVALHSSIQKSFVIARLVRATHFVFGKRKLDRPDKPGNDGVLFEKYCKTQLGGPHSADHDSAFADRVAN
jgi:hypothetical protein